MGKNKKNDRRKNVTNKSKQLIKDFEVLFSKNIATNTKYTTKNRKKREGNQAEN